MLPEGRSSPRITRKHTGKAGPATAKTRLTRKRPSRIYSLLKRHRVLLMSGVFWWVEKYREGTISLVCRNAEKAQSGLRGGLRASLGLTACGSPVSREMLCPWAEVSDGAASLHSACVLTRARFSAARRTCEETAGGKPGSIQRLAIFG